MDSNENGYRESHSSVGYGQRYLKTYTSGYYAAQWTDIERPLLENVFQSLAPERKTCLDFACGTGRISKVASIYFQKTVGIDISGEMLKVAGDIPNATLIKMDLTKESLDERFDVVTSFRFFLNAEDSLRRDALIAIKKHMAPDGLLITNIHMNGTSPMGFIYKLYYKLKGKKKHNILTFEEYEQLLTDAGFVIIRTDWYGYLPRLGHLFPKLSARLVHPFEKIARTLRCPKRFAQSFLVVAKIG